MNPFLRWTVVSFALLWPWSSEAQIFGPGIPIPLPVIDNANLTVNSATAGQTAGILDLETINLSPSVDQPRYDLSLYEKLLLGMSEGAGPRPTSVRSLDYFHTDLQPALKQMAPGFSPDGDKIEGVGILIDSALNTDESLLGQLTVNGGQESDVRYDETAFDLWLRNETVPGNLAAQQTGNAIALWTADTLRRQEK